MESFQWLSLDIWVLLGNPSMGDVNWMISLPLGIGLTVLAISVNRGLRRHPHFRKFSNLQWVLWTCAGLQFINTGINFHRSTTAPLQTSAMRPTAQRPAGAEPKETAEPEEKLAVVPATLDQHIGVLNRGGDVGSSLRALNQWRLEDDEQQRVKLAVLELLERQPIGLILTDEAMSLLRKIGLDEADVPVMTRVFIYNNTDSVFQFLLPYHEQSMTEYYLKVMEKPGAISARASSFFEMRGAASEAEVMRLLDSQRVSSRLSAIRVLEKIGTERSIPQLIDLSSDRWTSRAAKQAIQAIERRLESDA